MTINALVRKLAARDHISEHEQQVLEAVIEPERRIVAGGALVQPGDKPDHSILMVSGVSARFTMLEDGDRQFTEINIAGDFVDLHSFLLRPMDHGVLALTDCVYHPAPHARLKHVTETEPHLTRLLWLETLIDAAIHRQWLVCLGLHDGLGRFAHLICELAVRLKSVGLSDGKRFDLPLTQGEAGDFLGLSLVHVNRTLMVLREMKLLEWRHGRVEIFDWDRLAEVAQFDPTYLRLTKEPV